MDKIQLAIRLVLYLSLILDENEARSIRRFRRQINQDTVPEYELAAPYGNYRPIPARTPTSQFPLWPFTHSFGGALNIVPGTLSGSSGKINIPIPGWHGIFDFAGKIQRYNGNFGVDVGNFVRPINPYNISLAELASLGQYPQFQGARASASEIPVFQLPYGWIPARCRPPYCNPFIHNYGFGITIEEGDERTLEGELDFPIPAASPGVGVRFPLEGALETGSSPYAFTYGHAINPIDIFQNIGVQRSTGRTFYPPLINPQSARRQQRTSQFI